MNDLLKNYNSIKDYFDKEQSTDLIYDLNKLKINKIRIALGNWWYSNLPFKYIHEIPNHFYLNFEFYIEL